jgi:hypothetical protein
MKIRRDSVFISSVLFTVVLLWLVPPFVKGALERYNTAGREQLDTGWRLYSEMWGAFDIASLTIVLIGLIVTWCGYFKKIRWTWFVMFVLVWGWFFPAMAYPDVVYPWYTGKIQTGAVPAFLLNAFGKPGLAQGLAQEMLIFAILVIALILPIKSFFGGAERNSKHSPPDDSR